MLSSVPHRPLLPGLYKVVPVGPDRVVVANAGRVVALSGVGFSARVSPLLAALDGRSTAEELEDRFPDIGAPVLAGLTAKGLLVDAASGPDPPGRAPQAAALALPGAPAPVASSARLSAATIAVVGCGAVGGAVAVLLAKAGVGRLVVIDDGDVGEADVAVSPLLNPPDAGRPRVQAVAGCCRGAGADRVEEAAVLPPGLRPDLAVLALGYGDIGATAADDCLAIGIPYLIHAQDALEATVGPLVNSGGRPCHWCLAARRLGHVAHLDEYLGYLDHRAAASPAPDAFLAAQSSLVAGVAATEALRALLSAEPLTSGAVLVLDLGGPVVQREALLPVPGCTGCARAAGGEP